MQYGLAFGYVLQRRNGFTNLLLLTVCTLLPVVGPIVLMGYRAEVAVRLVHDPELRRHPRFDFNRFAARPRRRAAAGVRPRGGATPGSV
jgi:hypothetical protein